MSRTVVPSSQLRGRAAPWDGQHLAGHEHEAARAHWLFPVLCSIVRSTLSEVTPVLRTGHLCKPFLTRPYVWSVPCVAMTASISSEATAGLQFFHFQRNSTLRSVPGSGTGARTGTCTAGTGPFYSAVAICTFLLLSFLKHERTAPLDTSLHAAANPVFILCALPGPLPGPITPWAEGGADTARSASVPLCNRTRVPARGFLAPQQPSEPRSKRFPGNDLGTPCSGPCMPWAAWGPASSRTHRITPAGHAPRY